MLRIVVIAVSLVISGASLFVSSAEAETPQGKKTVCVLSEIGKEFYLQKIGIMVFGNEKSNVSISEWKFSDRVYDLAAKLLKEKFNVERIPVPEGGFDAFYKKGDQDFRVEMEEAARKLSGAKSCDYRLVIVDGGSRYGSTNQFVGGIGVVERESLGEPYRYLHAISRPYLYDGRDHSLLNRWYEFNPFAGFDANVIRGPYQELEVIPETALPGVKDNPKIKEAAWRLLEKGVTGDLVEMFKTDKPQSQSPQANSKTKPANDDWAPF